MQEVRTFSLGQLVLAGVALVGITVLAAFDRVSADAVIAIYSGVLGAALASPLAAKAGHSEGRANGFREGVEAANGHEAAGGTVAP